MATLEDLQAELQRRSGGDQTATPTAAPAAEPSTGTTIDDIKAELARRQAAPEPTPEPTSRAGLAARTAIQGGTGAVLGLPALLQDAATGPINLMYMGQNYLTNKLNQAAGTNIPQAKLIPSAMTAVNQLGQNLADVAGTPQPQTPGEKAAVNVGSAALSALGPGGYGRLLARAPSATAASIGSQMAATPALDVASAVSGETAKEAIQQKGGGAGASTAGGLAASMLPYAAAVAGRRVITPVPSQLSPEQQALAKTLQEAGVPLSAGQATGSKNLQYIEDQAAKLPMGEFLVKNPTAGQQEAFTKAILGKAGITESAATPEVLLKARKNLGNTIDNVTSNYKVQFDPQYATDIYGVIGNYGKNLSTDQKNTIASYITDLKNAGGNISGDVYQKTRSNIGRAIRAQNGLNGDKEYQNALIGLQNALDDAAERSMLRAGAQDDAITLNQARQQYANLMTIEDAVARSGQAGTTGQITPNALSEANKFSIGKRRSVEGFGDLTQLSNAGKSFISPLPDTTTARRNAMLALGALAAEGYRNFGPLGAAAVAAAPPLAGGALNNPLTQRYLRNQVLPGKQQIPLGAIPGLLGQQ